MRLIRNFELPELGIKNPAGFAYSPVRNALLVSPSEDSKILAIVSFAPDVNDTIQLPSVVADPVNMAFDGKSNCLYFIDAAAEELVAIKSNDNGLPENVPNAVVRYNAKPFCVNHACGMTFDPRNGDLYILIQPASNTIARIIHISPDDNSGFDGPAAEKEGRIQSIILNSLPASPVSGVAMDPVNGHLYILATEERLLFEINQQGELLSTRDLSSLDSIFSLQFSSAQNMAFAPSGDQTDDPAIMNLYIADNGLKNEQGWGDIFEISLTPHKHFEMSSLYINDVAILEKNSGRVNMIFTVTLSQPARMTVTVDYETRDLTAFAPDDYVSVFGTLTFSKGDTSKQIVVEINSDEINEKNEMFAVNLNNARGFVTIADPQGVGTIIDDDNNIKNVPAQYATICEALQAASPGDTILVAPGIYQETVELSDKSVVLASWFLVTEDSSYISKTILHGSRTEAVLTINSSAGLSTTISGLTIRNGEDGISTHAKCNILNCKFIDNKDGIDYESGSGGLCRSNIFEYNKDDGIDLDHDVDICITDNIMRYNREDGIGLRLQSYTGPYLNYCISGNEIYHNGGDGIQLIDYSGPSNRVIIIERNLIYENQMAGLGCMGDGMTRENFEGADILERIFLFNNTFSGNACGVTGGDSLVAINNIFINHDTLAMKNTDAGSITCYNLFWNNCENFDHCIVDSARTLFSDPLLDPAYRLRAESPAIDAGIALFTWHGENILQLSPDSYDGVAPDMGAFEFSNSGNMTFIGTQKDPPGFRLLQNFPNPFNSFTNITYSLSNDNFVELNIYDILGRKVKTLVSKSHAAGEYYVEFDATHLSSGLYFYTLCTGKGRKTTRKMLLLK